MTRIFAEGTDNCHALLIRPSDSWSPILIVVLGDPIRKTPLGRCRGLATGTNIGEGKIDVHPYFVPAVVSYSSLVFSCPVYRYIQAVPRLAIGA